MKAIVLAGGFAKRLWPLTHEQAKPLIDVGGVPVINYIIQKLETLKNDGIIDEIFVSVNSKFEDDFKKWMEKYGFVINLIVENTMHEGEKLGAIGGIEFLINKTGLNEDVLIVNADNLFGDSFRFSDAINFFIEKQCPVICGYDVKTKERARIFGVILSDENNKIIDFIEKPEDPKSTLISMGFYLFKKSTLELMKKYVAEGNPRDKPGEFIQWLYKRDDVFVFPYDGDWFDIGDHETLNRAREFVKNRH